MDSRYADYASSIIPTPYRVAGVLLRPFCIGHWLLMERIKCKFLSEVGTAASDLLLAVLICSHSFEDGQRLLADPGQIDAVVNRWSKPLRRFWGWRFSWTGAALTFKDYLAEGMKQPQILRRDGGIEPSAPWQETFRLKLMRWGYTASEVMNMYLPAAWYAFYTIAELESVASATRVTDVYRPFVSEKMAKIIEQAKSRDQEQQDNGGTKTDS